ncbi:polyketide cyclase [Planococcus antarcticus DSM 14505]|uniref:Polyketide cyclase n=1 Tax=Planococcus antarcticus DSM 14505 TaxID=1185653 RepID=A0ABM6D6V3_9BACL|nr:ester cyclase [Planococcus antarcticus]ANU11208.1 polyketide cyclase [Planococcus antarcticus DSM 14505]
MSENKFETVKEVEHVRNKKPSNVFYGDSEEVQPVGFMDYNEFSKSTKRIQSMEGFSKEYRDIVDYIMSITHKIWEEKGIGVIYETYHNDVVMHTGVNSIQGVSEVVSGTLQTLHAFPDRKLYGENVIWSGNDKEGFLSSHRIVSNTTNLGDSSFGPATGKRVMFRTIVDCFVHSNRIVEEWLVRDNLYIVKQLGYDPVEVAKLLAKQSVHKGPASQRHFGISEVRKGQFMPAEFIRKSTAFEIGDFTLELYNKIWERRLFNYVNDFYAENANVHFICGTDLTGSQQIQGMLISLFASFPNAAFFVDRVTCNERNQEGSWDVAVRWRLQGLHEGIGYFGTPSGQSVEILGISHLQINDEKVTEEWLTFDGLDVLKQIYMQIENDSNEKVEGESLA